MTKIKNVFGRILPKYSYLPLAAMLALNCIAYFGTRTFTTNMHHYSMHTVLDSMIPFCPAFISVYLLAYAQWIIGYGLIAKENRYVFKWIVKGELIAKSMAFLCFILIPTTISRPEITGTDLWSGLTNYIYRTDAPDNLFPSVHCLESWVCFRGAMYLKKPGKYYKYFCLVFTLLVFASTVLVKQHVILDMIGAVIFVETGLFISKKLCNPNKKLFQRRTNHA